MATKTETTRILNTLNGSADLKKAEKRLKSPVLWGDLPGVLGKAGEAHFRAVAGVAHGLTRTDLALAGLVDLLVEKGVFTLDEYNEKEAEMTRSFVESTNTPSPMQEQAESLAPQGSTVERLVEVPGSVEESFERARLVEG